MHRKPKSRPKKFSGINISGKNDEQQAYLRSIDENIITFVNGYAGTGKTYLATLCAIKGFLEGDYEKVVFSRPCIEAGEKVGFLPGNLNDKTEPYMTAIMDVLEETIGRNAIDKFISEKRIFTRPIGYMRGITFKRSFVILDEAQNVTEKQMRLFLTRLGEGSKLVITGDSRQSDIPGKNGFVDALKRFCGVKDIGIIELSRSCIVRHPLVQEIEERYESL